MPSCNGWYHTCARCACEEFRSFDGRFDYYRERCDCEECCYWKKERAKALRLLPTILINPDIVESLCSADTLVPLLTAYYFGKTYDFSLLMVNKGVGTASHKGITSHMISKAIVDTREDMLHISRWYNHCGGSDDLWQGTAHDIVLIDEQTDFNNELRWFDKHQGHSRFFNHYAEFDVVIGAIVEIEESTRRNIIRLLEYICGLKTLRLYSEPESRYDDSDEFYHYESFENNLMKKRSYDDGGFDTRRPNVYEDYFDEEIESRSYWDEPDTSPLY